ncbi:hypothetical protein DIZ76_010950 [Coccidioides immitis]|nr:hypothetical protein DIZ76_010950 [Coccidioides immitis]
MVGVPGRSKGCHTCRRRKIAVSAGNSIPAGALGQKLIQQTIQCGLQRPVCIQCTKSNRVCAGYQRERIFVLVNPGAKERYTVPEQTSSTSKLGGDAALTVTSTVNRSHVTISRCNDGVCSPNSAGVDTVFRASKRQFVLNAFGLHCLSAIQSCRIRSDRYWLLLLPNLPMRSKALEISALALSTIALGRVYGDTSMVMESLKLYTRSLYELQRALYNRALMYEDETLAACLALSLYELLECPAEGRSGYESHCKGLVSLVQHRGVQAHRSGLGHLLFVTVRAQAIFYAMQAHSPTFLAEREWMEIPWQDSSKTPMDRILDCLAQAPKIFGRSDNLSHMRPAEQLWLAYDIVTECWQLNETLQALYDDFESSGPAPLFWPSSSRREPSIGASPFDDFFPAVKLSFADLRTAGTLMMYWAALLMLWSGICDLYQLIRSIDANLIDEQGDDSIDSHDRITQNQRRLPSLGKCSNYMPLARNICGSVEYCLQEKMQILGPCTLSAPLGIVLGVLRDKPRYQREVSWIKGVFENIQWKGIRACNNIK